MGGKSLSQPILNSQSELHDILPFGLSIFLAPTVPDPLVHLLALAAEPQSQRRDLCRRPVCIALVLGLEVVRLLVAEPLPVARQLVKEVWLRVGLEAFAFSQLLLSCTRVRQDGRLSGDQ